MSVEVGIDDERFKEGVIRRGWDVVYVVVKRHVIETALGFGEDVWIGQIFDPFAIGGPLSWQSTSINAHMGQYRVCWCLGSSSKPEPVGRGYTFLQ